MDVAEFAAEIKIWSELYDIPTMEGDEVYQYSALRSREKAVYQIIPEVQ